MPLSTVEILLPTVRVLKLIKHKQFKLEKNGAVVMNTKQIYLNHEGKFKLLGVKYDFLKVDFTYDNLTEKTGLGKTLLHDWAFRNLTIFVMVTVVKTLALSILVQRFSVLPNPKNQNNLKISQTIFLNFNLNGKIKKFCLNIIIYNRQDGVLKFRIFFRLQKVLN